MVFFLMSHVMVGWESNIKNWSQKALDLAKLA